MKSWIVKYFPRKLSISVLCHCIDRRGGHFSSPQKKTIFRQKVISFQQIAQTTSQTWWMAQIKSKIYKGKTLTLQCCLCCIMAHQSRENKPKSMNETFASLGNSQMLAFTFFLRKFDPVCMSNFGNSSITLLSLKCMV